MLRMLIVEDEPVNREFLILALRPYGQSVAAGTGEEGLKVFTRALAEANPFDVVFLDIMLPGIDGLKTLEMLRAEEAARDVPEADSAQVIVTTVLDDDRAASRAFIQGHAVSYMTKPFRARQITEELAKLGLIEA